MIGRPRTTDHEQIRLKVLGGSTAAEVSKSLGICEGQVRKVAKSFGISVSPPKRNENPLYEKIVQRVLETQNGHQVDLEFGLGQGSSKRICRMLGVEYPIRIGRMKENLSLDEKVLKNPEWDEIRSRYLSGESQSSIARRMGLSQPSIGYALKMLEIEVGKGAKSRSQRKFLPDNLEEIYNSGKSCREIGEMFGVQDEVVRERLILLNIPRRVGKASAEKNPQWKGGRKQTMHYYRRQSYEVAAICLGKPVPKGHIIHHLDENPENNNPRNLVLFESQSLHAKYHQTALKNRLIVGSEEAILLALEIGAVPLPEPSFPIEL